MEWMNHCSVVEEQQQQKNELRKPERVFQRITIQKSHISRRSGLLSSNNIVKMMICFYHKYIFPSLGRLYGQETHKHRWKRSVPRWASAPFVASHLVVSAWSAFSRVSFSLLSWFCSCPRGWGTEHYHYSPLTLHGRADHINNLTGPWSFFSPWKNLRGSQRETTCSGALHVPKSRQVQKQQLVYRVILPI